MLTFMTWPSDLKTCFSDFPHSPVLVCLFDDNHLIWKKTVQRRLDSDKDKHTVEHSYIRRGLRCGMLSLIMFSVNVSLQRKGFFN